jgi:hypothetical protein
MAPIQTHREVTIRALIFKSDIVFARGLRQETIYSLIPVCPIAFISIVIVKTFQAVSRSSAWTEACMDFPLSLCFLERIGMLIISVHIG